MFHMSGSTERRWNLSGNVKSGLAGVYDRRHAGWAMYDRGHTDARALSAGWRGLFLGPLADHALHLVQMLAHLFECKAEGEKAFRGLVRHVPRQALVADRTELIDIGVKIGLD